MFCVWYEMDGVVFILWFRVLEMCFDFEIFGSSGVCAILYCFVFLFGFGIVFCFLFLSFRSRLFKFWG